MAPFRGIVITPSHNPPEDGGIKYNPPNGGPADTDVTGWIEAEANRLLKPGCEGVRRAAVRAGAPAPTRRTPRLRLGLRRRPAERRRPGRGPRAGLKLGVDPLGGASVAYWQAIAERYGLDLTVVNPTRRPALRLHDRSTGTARSAWTRSSPYAMASLVKLRDGFDLALRQRRRRRPARHRHAAPPGLLNPNHYLSAAIAYLFRIGRAGPPSAGLARRSCQQRSIDRVAADLGRAPGRGAGRLQVVRAGLLDGSLGVRRRGERRAPRSCAATAARGRPTRTASCCACWPPR